MKLTRLEKKMIEEYWRNIDEYRTKRDFRFWQVTEKKEVDENIGGGRSSGISDTTAQKAMIIANDDTYQHYKKIIEAIEKTYEEMEQELKEIVHMRYWNDLEYMTWDDIAIETCRSNRTIFRMRNTLIDRTAKKLGWL